MAKYAATMESTAGGATPTIGDVSTQTTVRRIKVYDLLFSSDGAPADVAFEWIVQRHTAHGVRTTVTPKPLDSGDGACVGEAGENHTTDSTVTTGEELLDFALNQRGTFRWIASPDSELIIPATAENGLSFICNHASSVLNQKVSCLFDE